MCVAVCGRRKFIYFCCWQNPLLARKCSSRNLIRLSIPDFFFLYFAHVHATAFGNHNSAKWNCSSSRVDQLNFVFLQYGAITSVMKAFRLEQACGQQSYDHSAISLGFIPLYYTLWSWSWCVYSCTEYIPYGLIIKLSAIFFLIFFFFRCAVDVVVVFVCCLQIITLSLISCVKLSVCICSNKSDDKKT